MYLFTNPYGVWFASLGAVTSEDVESVVHRPGSVLG